MIQRVSIALLIIFSLISALPTQAYAVDPEAPVDPTPPVDPNVTTNSTDTTVPPVDPNVTTNSTDTTVPPVDPNVTTNSTDTTVPPVDPNVTTNSTDTTVPPVDPNVTTNSTDTTVPPVDPETPVDPTVTTNSTSNILADQTSCETISGSWDQTTSTCTVSSFTIGNNDVLEIASGVTLSVNTLLENHHGTLINNGILIVIDSASFENNGHFENLGDFQNLGATYITDTADNTYAGTISNTGSMELASNADLNNYGIMNSTGILDVASSSTLDNFNLIDFGTGASISINPSGTLNNEGTILSCDWIIEGTISGPGAVTDTCPSANLLLEADPVYTHASDESFNIVLADQTSCETIWGSWDQTTSTCTVSSCKIGNNDVLEIASGVTLRVSTLMQTHGNLINKGTLIITDTGEFGINGYFENLGDFQNLGTTYVIGTLDNKNTSTINNAGRIELTGNGDLNNDATMNNPGTLDVGGSSTLDNFNLIDFGTGASISINPSGTFTNEGTILFCDWVIDGKISGPGTVTDTCPSSNGPPVFPSLGTLEANEEMLFEFDAYASDPDYEQTLTYSLLGEPEGMTVDSVTGTISWMPKEVLEQTYYTFDIIATDDGLPPLSSTITVTIMVGKVNASPFITEIREPPQISIGQSLRFSVSATDTDLPPQNWSFSLYGAPVGATINPQTGEFQWSPLESQKGTHTFDVLVTDNGSPPIPDTETLSITVIDTNTAPAIIFTSPPKAAEDTLFQQVVLATDTDLPQQYLVFSLASAPSGMTIDPVTGLISWIPDESYGGTTQEFEVVVSDLVLPPISVSEKFVVTADENNLPPEITEIPPQITITNTSYEYQIMATDSDLPNQTLTYNLGPGVPSGMEIDASTGLIRYTGDISQEGTYTFDIIVTDDGLPPTSNSATFEITVISPTSPPEIVSPPVDSIINDRTPTISGTANPGSTVKIFVDNNHVGTTVTENDGNWSFIASTVIPDGPHTITATATKTPGNTSLPSTPTNITIVTTITLTGIVRDFQASHPDFEYLVAEDLGMVNLDLGGDGKPVYSSKTVTKTTTGIENYYQWYNNVGSINDCTTYDIKLTPSDDDLALFSYSNPAFYPIDNKLLGNEENSHNYHFTYQLKAKFVYQPGQSVTLNGDDDIWVFIDHKLALDQGGVLPPRTGIINLDTLGLVEGQTYDFDLFFAERHSTESNLGITTNVQLIPVPAGQCKQVDATNDAASTNTNPVTIPVLLNDYNAATINSVTPPTSGTVQISDNSIIYTPATGFSGKAYFSYEAKDASGSADSATVVVTVELVTNRSIDKYISKNSDDAEEHHSRVRLSDGDLDMAEKQYIGLRFTDLQIPKGAIITNAYIQFAAEDERGDKGYSSVKLYRQDTDNAKTFTSANYDISSRASKSTYVDWTIADWKRQNDAGSAQKSPNISSLIQKVVDRPGWKDGNSIVIIADKKSDANDRDAYSFEGKASMAARLHVDFQIIAQ